MPDKLLKFLNIPSASELWFINSLLGGLEKSFKISFFSKKEYAFLEILLI